MKIVKAELQKLLADKVIIMIIFLSVIANITVIMSGSSYRSDMKYINNVIAHTGAKVTKESIASAKNILKKDYKTLENEFADLFGYFPESVDEIFKYIPDRAESHQNYMALLNMIETAQMQIESDRNDEKDIYFSAECITIVNELLYSKLLFCVYAELSIIGIFVVFKSIGYELGKNTHLCLYSCKIGRSLQKAKLISCFIFVSVTYIFICLLCLTVYFLLYSQSSFLLSSLCSVNMSAVTSEYNFTVLGYLLSHMGVGYAIVVIYLLTAYTIGLLINNQYIGITALAASQAIFIAGTGSESDFNKMFSYTPVTLLISLNKNVSVNTEKWFLHAGGAFSSESFVIKVLIIWGIISVIGIAISNVVFRKRDI